MAKKSLWERFHEKFEITENGCWKWTGTFITGGYGAITANGKKAARAHRVAYELYKGPIPDGLHLDHLCRNRWCVNPDHVEPVTNKVNSLRGLSPRIVLHHEHHCTNGHPVNEQNTFFDKRTGRVGQCRVCRREKRAGYKENALQQLPSVLDVGTPIRLRDAIAAAGLVPNTLCRIAGMSNALVYKTLKGSRTRLHSKERIAAFFGLRVDQIIWPYQELPSTEVA